MSALGGEPSIVNPLLAGNVVRKTDKRWTRGIRVPELDRAAGTQRVVSAHVQTLKIYEARMRDFKQYRTRSAIASLSALMP
jgi:hypothetical protein